MSGTRRGVPGAFVRSDLPMASLALGLITIVIGLSPVLQDALVLDRRLVASGQLWRILTGSLVHFSPSHLGYDLLVVFVVGAMIERSGRSLLPLLLSAAIAVGIGVLEFAPGIARYGGLSGIAYALVVVLALDGARAPGLTRGSSVAMLVLIVAKLCWEATSGGFVFVSDPGAAFQPVPVAHAAGVLAGVAYTAMLGFAKKRCRIRASAIRDAVMHGAMQDA